MQISSKRIGGFPGSRRRITTNYPSKTIYPFDINASPYSPWAIYSHPPHQVTPPPSSPDHSPTSPSAPPHLHPSIYQQDRIQYKEKKNLKDNQQLLFKALGNCVTLQDFISPPGLFVGLSETITEVDKGGTTERVSPKKGAS